MLHVAAIAIFVTMALALARALLGPSIFDRILAANMFGTKVVLLLAVLAFFQDRPDFLDLALAYALINFIGVLAVLEFFQSRLRRQARPSAGEGGQ
ncbi:monovalent cation/H+ antiporter complex subunit F [Pseudokordiimonas caeni]|uniref:monovalent cation/H+ antiporter complex subunit F n=1 Tax=Pseudokordiimonas caeni TaxID=2997908 RepID=UPI00281231E8|nr:monovalent cation/H+ antiporter complex subunit F [Pseudokordiimonas caeni]